MSATQQAAMAVQAELGDDPALLEAKRQGWTSPFAGVLGAALSAIAFNPSAQGRQIMASTLVGARPGSGPRGVIHTLSAWPYAPAIGAVVSQLHEALEAQRTGQSFHAALKQPLRGLKELTSAHPVAQALTSDDPAGHLGASLQRLSSDLLQLPHAHDVPGMRYSCEVLSLIDPRALSGTLWHRGMWEKKQVHNAPEHDQELSADSPWRRAVLSMLASQPQRSEVLPERFQHKEKIELSDMLKILVDRSQPEAHLKPCSWTWENGHLLIHGSRILVWCRPEEETTGEWALGQGRLLNADQTLSLLIEAQPQRRTQLPRMEHARMHFHDRKLMIWAMGKDTSVGNVTGNELVVRGHRLVLEAEDLSGLKMLEDQLQREQDEFKALERRHLARHKALEQAAQAIIDKRLPPPVRRR